MSSGFTRAISLLAGSSAAAQALTALAMPFLSRLYGPTDFGALAVFMGIVTTVSVAACLRYDVAVALPERDDESLALLALSFLAAGVVAMLALAVVALAFDWFAGWVHEPAVYHAKWLIPFGIFVAAAWNALQNWHIRKRHFGLMAQAKLGQSGAAVGTQAGLALSGVGSLGLLAGPPLGFAISGLWLLRSSWSGIVSWLRRSSLVELRQAAYAYRHYPVYSTWEALCNQAAIHLPVILIAGMATAAEAGYLMLAMYVLQAPMSLLGAAIGQVFLSRAPQAHRDQQLNRFTTEVLTNLAKAGAGPILAAGILSPVIFPIVFGAGWERAGWLVSWMVPWFLFQFLASPISMVLHVVGAQRTAMALQLFSLAVRLGVTWGAARLSPDWIAEAYALSGMAVYLCYFVVIQSRLGASARGWWAALGAAWRWVVPWIMGALLMAWLIVQLGMQLMN